MSKARVRGLESLNGLLRSDWEDVISQACLGRENTYIATQYFLEAVPQVEIAEELNLERSAVSKRLPKIMDKLKLTARKLGYL